MMRCSKKNYNNSGRNLYISCVTAAAKATLVLSIALTLLSCEKPKVGGDTETAPPPKPTPKETTKPTMEETAKPVLKEIPRPGEISLFDGKTLGHWKINEFWKPGKVYVKDGAIQLETGNDLTGISWKGPLVHKNYEVSLDAMRTKGEDFFCCLTFPVGANSCSFVIGGWGGQVVGLSNIDYFDAANNETTQIMSFESGRWYHVRVRVTKNKIEAWIDEEKMVDVVTTGRKLDIRMEVEESRPLGVASWQTGTALRNIRLKTFTD
ncbi:MAG: DUF1080 domain-containing protein [Sedimentisphaerales bacterium]|nr:DUF1080 domain-containing protein [Sedimentisphaerales bacterium]